MRGPDLVGAIDHLELSAHLAGEEAPSYWRAHALVHLSAARHRVGDDEGAHDALAQARAALDVLPDTGALGALCDETDAGLRQRSRRDGYLGQELSAAEFRIFRRLVDGLSVSDVAHELWLSPNTVKTHRRNIYRKLGASNREELARRAAEIGVAPRGEADHRTG
jgi:LuxR family maltose regulon positive regulatory protein